jgi:hypothetical protein
MKKFNSIVDLIKRLKQDEYSVVKKYLTFQVDKTSNKSLHLLELIKKSTEPKANLIQKEIYNCSNLYAFNKLVDRLKSKILDSFLIDSNLNNNYPERIKINFELRKRLIQSDILSQKGLRDEADILCKRIITKARTYELYDIISQAILIRQRFASVRKRSSEVRKMHKDIELYESKYKSYIKCQIEYHSIINKISNSKDKSEYVASLIDSIKVIGNEYELFKSKMAYFYLNFLQTDYCQVNNNYIQAAEHLNILYDLLKEKSIYSKNQMGTILLNISSNHIHLGNYEEAIEFANKSRPYFQGNIINTSLVFEQLFYANYYKGNIASAKEIVLNQIQNVKLNNLNLNNSNWSYYLAVLHFSVSHFDKCLQILDQISDSNLNSEDIRINKRILKIITLIELNRIDEVDALIENLASYIKRIKKQHKLNKRYQFIFKILLKLSNCHYNFKIVETSRKKQLSILSGNNSTMMWKHKDPELFPFHVWFNSKANYNLKAEAEF